MSFIIVYIIILNFKIMSFSACCRIIVYILILYSMPIFLSNTRLIVEFLYNCKCLLYCVSLSSKLIYVFFTFTSQHVFNIMAISNNKKCVLTALCVVFYIRNFASAFITLRRMASALFQAKLITNKSLN